MVAPRAETMWTFGPNRKVVGIVLSCPECEWPLRCETGNDHPHGKAPDLIANAGPLGFIARCDACGFRVQLRGDRLPTVAMMDQS